MIFGKSIEKTVRDYMANDPEIKEELERLQFKIIKKYLAEKGERL